MTLEAATTGAICLGSCISGGAVDDQELKYAKSK